ncbi:NADH:flavin oxidoreductase/NADH oxidase family protein [Avibacterium sp. 20-15]|uniref:NADH:flavin oxidoreductase/NADH oxidase family protein n=1 Tax=unclassified Avibacterium TaxID=2685287 RepID=UPI002026F00E|nr:MULTISPECIES: NADH:flavin oxidoreductase/NADH oxidase family protein [unclassified Avibacterium]MCW9731984.1 NADH:flavin oxidoreductase/NADH oxidase family protein [Avibacterium sp. 20-15]URL05535.1 NADH:flavin oxidoreductase/NADH oxidase family protein [Avibacterium sp. 20-132]
MLFESFTFKNGKTAKNRFFKSAMEEQLAANNHVSGQLVKLYDTWAKGGAGILVTGNVMICQQGKGSPDDVVQSDDGDLPMLKKWATAGTQDNTLLIMQINHAGKQSPKALNAEPVAPSAVPLSGMESFFNPPRALTIPEIHTLIAQFAKTAQLAEQAGFSGVQIHAAHGYLISQFLSPHHNRRDDEYGGSLDNRMRFLVAIYQAIRAAVQPEFLVGVKLNSADFQKGGFDESESVQVIAKLSELGIDFIEVSGGNYESPVMLSSKPSSQKREAYFLDYAQKARTVSQVPLIITGGFRSQSAMNDALTSGELDFVGVARPFALVPDLPNQIQAGTYQTVELKPVATGVAKIDEKMGSVLEMGWYMYQMARMGVGKKPDPNTSAWRILWRTLWQNGKAGLKSSRV